MSIKNKDTWTKIHPSSKHVPGVSVAPRLCGWQRDFRTGEYNRCNSAVIAWLPGGRKLRK